MSSLSKTHHVRRELCTTRPAYRSGRQLKAVKVYTVSQESRYLLVQGIPALGFSGDLIKEFALYGAIEEYRLLDEYPCDEFTEVMWIKVAKRKMDDYEFRGGKLHVCYAPEYEAVDDTRQKLSDRRRAVARRLQQLGSDLGRDTSKSGETELENPESGRLGIESSSDKPAANDSRVFPSSSLSIVPVSESGNYPTSLSVNPISTQLHSSHLNSSSTSTLLPAVPPPPPPPMSSPFPAIFSAGNFFPSLPPPPVERFPTRLPPPHISPDVRWQHYASPLQSSAIVQHFRPPPPVVRSGVLRTNFVPESVSTHSQSSVRSSSSNVPRHPSKSVPGEPTIPPSKAAPFVSAAPSSMASATSSSPPLIVKNFKQAGPTPRFVPRQLTARSASQKVVNSSDPVVAELKRNAFVLGAKVQGPSLPGEEEVRRKEFKLTETGSESVDRTVRDIRQKVSRRIDALWHHLANDGDLKAAAILCVPRPQANSAEAELSDRSTSPPAKKLKEV